jgi:pimeloyl-ACP methyl ester carboxylesterase
MTMSEDALTERAQVGPMSVRRLILELRAPIEYASYLGLGPLLRMLYACGEQHPVLVLPGGLTGDWSTAILRWGIRGHGYHAHGWGLGTNTAANEEKLAGMRARVDELYAAHDSKITIIGWSLGGIYGRMLARDRPEKIRQVITLGSPFRMVESDRFAPFGQAWWDWFVQEHAQELDLLFVHEHHRPPLTVPLRRCYPPPATWIHPGRG